MTNNKISYLNLIFFVDDTLVYWTVTLKSPYVVIIIKSGYFLGNIRSKQHGIGFRNWFYIANLDIYFVN